MALKTYLTSPPILVSPFEGELLTLYLAVSDFATSAALVRERYRVQQPVYYYSRAMRGAEKRYLKMEKLNPGVGNHIQKTPTLLSSPYRRSPNRISDEANIT